ncbi:hypothetical protein AUR67_03850 [Pseudoalteromonas sp. XI10]|uniref:hypothetical protein n=1 Tax=Pseudoalteromonas sp. XI10 TaxID=1766621 RepID=UPI00073357AB|nr:hypothetical protein [Pseudoalteromonas sp. XI10]KTG22204.1 hypothetical protein AUR67_03850 [Pseudoalteromonas sp. XI10]
MGNSEVIQMHKTIKFNILSFVIFLCIIFSVWINPSLFGGVIPMPIPYLLVCILILFYKINVRTIWYFTFFLCAVLVSSLLSPGFYNEPTSVLLGGFQLVGSISLFLILVDITARNNNSEHIERWIFRLFYFLVFLVFFEIFFGGREVLELLRNLIYEKSLYTSFERDVREYGLVRPMALNREPAHLAFLLSTLSFFIINKKTYSFNKKLLLSFALFFVFILLIRSPVLIVLPLAQGFIWCFVYKKNAFSSVVGLIFLTICVAVFYAFIFDIISSRFDNIMAGSDFSAVARLVAPIMVCVDVLRDYPIFGVGVSSDGTLFKYVYDLFVSFGFKSRLLDMDNSSIANYVTNYFFQIFIYFGAIGGGGLLLIKYKFLSLYNSKVYILLGLFFIFSLAIGGLVTSKVWVSFFIIWLAVKDYLGFEYEENICR